MKEFKAFILRGNVLDLAVAVVIGAAFGAVISSLVKDMLTPLLGLLNVPDFAAASVKVGSARLRYGVFLNAVVSFVLVAAAIFLFVVKPVNHMMVRREPEEPESPFRDCPHCLSVIPKAATRCAHCTQAVDAVA